MERHFPDQHISVFPEEGHTWLVNAPGMTSREVGETLGILSNQSGQGQEPPRNIIVSFNAYYGWNSPDVWEWISKRWTV